MEQLPKTLDEFYDRILRDIGEGDQEQARLALQWLAFAARPISLKELAEAVIIRREDEPYVNDKDRFLDYKDILEILPSGLVSKAKKNYLGYDMGSDIEYASSEEEGENKDVDEYEQRSQQSNDSFEDEPEVKDIENNLMVQFAHFSVKEYLISDRSGPEHHIDEISANKLIAESCFAYLIYTGIQEPVVTEQIYTDFPLLHYAANCWPHHVNILQSQSRDEDWLKLALCFLQNDSCAWRIWAAVGFDGDDTEFTKSITWLTTRERQISIGQSPIHPISWASGLGLSCLLQHLLVENVDLNEIPQTSIFGNPLHNAAYNGHFQVVQMLLTVGLHVDRKGGHFGSALQAASANGHIENVRLLLEEGADVNAQGGLYSTALQAASGAGRVEIVRLLLQEGADVNARGGLYGAALQAASNWARSEIVRLLLQEGADVNAQGGRHGTALQAASVVGHIEIVRLLLQGGADVHAQDGRYVGALRAAASHGRTDIVQMLLDSGTDNRANGEWDVMCKEVEDNIKDPKGVSYYSPDGEEGLRATKLLLDGWLAEKQSKEAEEATRPGTPKIRQISK